MRWSDSPILNLLGGKDDYTPYSLAQKLTEGIKDVGGDCSYILYEEGLHGFDSVMPKTFWPDFSTGAANFLPISLLNHYDCLWPIDYLN